jgi:hypothetical protein
MFAYKTVVINSRDCVQSGTTGSDFSCLFQGLISPINETYMHVISAIIPHTWFNIREPYTSINIVESLGAVYTVKLTEGNYTAALFDNMIKNVLTSASAANGNGYTFNAVTNLVTAQLSISVLGLNGSETISLSFPDNPFNCHMVVGGIRGNSYLLTSVSPQFEFPRVVSYSGVNLNYLTIKCKEIDPTFITSGTGALINYLFSYPIIGSANDIESIDVTTPQFSPIRVPFSRLNFQIVDAQNQFVDFNGSHVVFTIQLSCPYKNIFP